MAKYRFGSGKVLSTLGVLLTMLLLITSCSTNTDSKGPGHNSKDDVVLPPSGGPGNSGEQAPFLPDVIPPIVAPGLGWDTIALMARTDPANPQNERFLDDWRFAARNIDDEGRPLGPTYFGQSGPDGNALIGLPMYMFALPLVISANNNAYPLSCVEPVTNAVGIKQEIFGDTNCVRKTFEIFVPPYCYDSAVWLAGPFEDALWNYYRQAAKRRGEAWVPSQVDCGTWLADLQLLIMTSEVYEELNELHEHDNIFNPEKLIEALQENQQLLVPTRPPICMAERRHDGGAMKRGPIITAGLPATIGADDSDRVMSANSVGSLATPVTYPDPIVIGSNGVVSSICGINIGLANTVPIPPIPSGIFNVVNGTTTYPFVPVTSYMLDDPDFMGIISDEPNIVPGDLSVSMYNVQLGNGLKLDADDWQPSCALTEMMEFTNTSDADFDLGVGTGVTFTNLMGGTAPNTTVFATSDGDAVVDDDDTWAIFYNTTATAGEEIAVAVELLGIRRGDYRDVLHMTFDTLTSDLFLGLRADFELNKEETDGERQFMGYTISVWNGSTLYGRQQVRQDIADCYQASDVWARQFFVTRDFDKTRDHCLTDHCEVIELIPPLEAAEFAVRSQCFSNSRANQRWRTAATGYWSLNADHGVTGNVIVNPGWLAPHLDYKVYIQKFDEAIFKGPRIIATSNHLGELMIPFPTVTEGDEIMIQSEQNAGSDFRLIIPCVPEFTGFAGAPGIPYIPVTLGPPPIGPIGGPIGPIGPGPIGPIGPIGPVL